MKIKNFLSWIAEAILWYVFVYFLLFSLKNPVDIGKSALALLILAYAAAVACPLVRNSDEWRRVMGRGK